MLVDFLYLCDFLFTRCNSLQTMEFGSSPAQRTRAIGGIEDIMILISVTKIVVLQELIGRLDMFSGQKLHLAYTELAREAKS